MSISQLFPYCFFLSFLLIFSSCLQDSDLLVNTDTITEPVRLVETNYIGLVADRQEYRSQEKY